MWAALAPVARTNSIAAEHANANRTMLCFRTGARERAHSAEQTHKSRRWRSFTKTDDRTPLTKIPNHAHLQKNDTHTHTLPPTISSLNFALSDSGSGSSAKCHNKYIFVTNSTGRTRSTNRPQENLIKKPSSVLYCTTMFTKILLLQLTGGPHHIFFFRKRENVWHGGEALLPRGCTDRGATIRNATSAGFNLVGQWRLCAMLEKGLTIRVLMR